MERLVSWYEESSATGGEIGYWGVFCWCIGIVVLVSTGSGSKILFSQPFILFFGVPFFPLNCWFLLSWYTFFGSNLLFIFGGAC